MGGARTASWSKSHKVQSHRRNRSWLGECCKQCSRHREQHMQRSGTGETTVPLGTDLSFRLLRLPHHFRVLGSVLSLSKPGGEDYLPFSQPSLLKLIECFSGYRSPSHPTFVPFCDIYCRKKTRFSRPSDAISSILHAARAMFGTQASP